MPTRKLFWFAVAILTAVLMAAAPPAAFCDEWNINQLDLGATPADKSDALEQAIAMHGAPWMPAGENYFTFGFQKKLSEDWAVSARFLHSTITNAIVDLGLEISDGAISCPDANYVDLSMAQMPGGGSNGAVLLAAQCGNNIYATEGIVYPGEQRADWHRRELEGATGMNSLSVASVNAGDILYQTVLGANDSGVYGWQPQQGGTGSVGRQQYLPPDGHSPFVGNLDHAFDNDGNSHIVGTNINGELGYVMYPAGSLDPDENSFVNLGQASQEQSWRWPRVRVAPNGTVFVTVHNAQEGYYYVFYNTPDSGGHWRYLVTMSPGGPMGMYNSMAVDPVTGNAMSTFADSEGHTRIMSIKQDGSSSTETLDGKYGNPYGTATATGNGQAMSIWFSPEAMWSRLGAKVDF